MKAHRSVVARGAALFVPDWKITPRWTLTFALHNEFCPPRYEKDGNFFNFYPSWGHCAQRKVLAQRESSIRQRPGFDLDCYGNGITEEPLFRKPQRGVGFWLCLPLLMERPNNATWRLGTVGPSVFFETVTNSITCGLPLGHSPHSSSRLRRHRSAELRPDRSTSAQSLRPTVEPDTGTGSTEYEHARVMLGTTTSASNMLVSPGVLDLSADLRKEFPLSEKFRIILPGTLHNALNHPNYSPSATNIRAANAATIRNLNELHGPRSGQLALRNRVLK